MLTRWLRLRRAILSRAPIALCRKRPPRGVVFIFYVANLSDASRKKGPACLRALIFLCFCCSVPSVHNRSWMLRNQALASAQAVESRYLYWAESSWAADCVCKPRWEVFHGACNDSQTKQAQQSPERERERDQEWPPSVLSRGGSINNLPTFMVTEGYKSSPMPPWWAAP